MVTMNDFDDPDDLCPSERLSLDPVTFDDDNEFAHDDADERVIRQLAAKGWNS